MSVIRQNREQGVSLRKTFLIMLCVSIAITVLLQFTAFRTIQSFDRLSDATEAYIELQEAADSLMKASDYLTDEAQCFTVLGDRQHMENYFTEAEVTRRRDRAIEAMEKRLPDSKALQALKDAMKESLALMNREYYAMTLMLQAQEDEDIPEAMKDVVITEEDLARPAEEKKELARKMMHDDGYYDQKNTIRSHLSECLEDLKKGTRGTQSSMEERVHRELLAMTIMIIIQTLAIVLLLWVTTSLGINPLLGAVEHIKKDQKLPITGANEFRYLAGTYNTMYSAYKKSIDNLSYKASHDELTGVYNRAGYDLLLHSADLKTTALLLFDADRFKKINDRYGHETGDRVLQKLAASLLRNFRMDDYVCRIGGDEFVVLMSHVNEDVRHLIEKKVMQINYELSDTEDGMPPVSVSVGVAMCLDTTDQQELFHDADMALYYVKDHGRNGCCFYDPRMKEKTRES